MKYLQVKYMTVRREATTMKGRPTERSGENSNSLMEKVRSKYITMVYENPWSSNSNKNRNKP